VAEALRSLGHVAAVVLATAPRGQAHVDLLDAVLAHVPDVEVVAGTVDRDPEA